MTSRQLVKSLDLVSRGLAIYPQAVSFREELLRWRADNSYTQERAAQELEVTVATISKWERGVHEPDQERVIANLAAAGIRYERGIIDGTAERMGRAENRIDELFQRIRTIERDMYGAERVGRPLVDEDPPVIPASGIDRLGREVEELRRRVDALDERAPGEGDPPSGEDQPQSGQAG